MILFGIITERGNGLLVKGSKSRRPGLYEKKNLGLKTVFINLVPHTVQNVSKSLSIQLLSSFLYVPYNKLIFQF